MAQDASGSCLTAVTNTGDPDYYHRVVDCQWACPAHTPVPEYIRLVAEGRFSEAYVVNRNSNIFPGILGRVCDRPCEPACRRGRIDDKPVAICRIKRVAADYRTRDDVPTLRPPEKLNGKRVALLGGGPASLSVAFALAPLGYQLTLIERESAAGGFMRSQVPAFRLPAEVLAEEVDAVLGMGVETRLGTEVKSLRAVLGEGFDAVFVGTGAPVGRDLPIPGREEAGEHIHVGLSFLANSHFAHLTSLSGTVVVIGGGNTAMDCCRTALRLGATRVLVIAPEAYDQMLASPWEREDAEAEGVEMKNLLLPVAFAHAGGRLKGVTFQPLHSAYDSTGKWAPQPTADAPLTVTCDHVVLAIGQAASFPFVERDLGIDFDERGMPVVDKTTFQSTLGKVFFGGDSAFGPKNIIWAVAHGREAAISIHRFLSGQDVHMRPARQGTLVSQKMGAHDWSYNSRYSVATRQKSGHTPLAKALKSLEVESETGFDLAGAQKEAARCLNCDVQTVFAKQACIECDACVDICPVDCITFAAVPENTTITAAALTEILSAPRQNSEQPLLIDGPLATGRLLFKDEDLCVHCGLCAERCPTGAWDMQKFTLMLPTAREADLATTD